jgi:hypothetical protein
VHHAISRVEHGGLDVKQIIIVDYLAIPRYLQVEEIYLRSYVLPMQGVKVHPMRLRVAEGVLTEVRHRAYAAASFYLAA